MPVHTVETLHMASTTCLLVRSMLYRPHTHRLDIWLHPSEVRHCQLSDDNRRWRERRVKMTSKMWQTTVVESLIPFWSNRPIQGSCGPSVSHVILLEISVVVHPVVLLFVIRTWTFTPVMVVLHVIGMRYPVKSILNREMRSSTYIKRISILHVSFNFYSLWMALANIFVWMSICLYFSCAGKPTSPLDEWPICLFVCRYACLSVCYGPQPRGKAWNLWLGQGLNIINVRCAFEHWQ